MKRHLVLLAITAVALIDCHAHAGAAVPGMGARSVKKCRRIASVEHVGVEVPAGKMPRLPWQVLVTYSDGSREWRQVRWNNASVSDERDQTDTLQHPVGSRRAVDGVIIGDNTTADGYPVIADIMVSDKRWQVPSNTPKAKPLPMSAVKITGDNRLTSNRDLDISEILKWDIRQQLYNYRDTYGLSTEGYPVSDGWDSPTTKLKGHGSGHYMSALALAFASATDDDQKRELLQRIEIMVNQLRECQERTHVWDDSLGRYWEARDLAPEGELEHLKGTWEAFDRYKLDYTKYGYGYLNAIPAQHPLLIECYRPYNNDQWVWAPYYSIHKQLAGLIDIATVLRDEDSRTATSGAKVTLADGHLSVAQMADKALLIASEMGLWVWNRLHYRTFVSADGSQEERQARPGNRYEMWNMYIAGEVGGMAESLSRLSAMVTDADAKAHLAEAANYFDSPAFFNPLADNVDDIRTRHANQHIPMITGALRSYINNGNPIYYNLAVNFWNLVQGRYTYAMGGVGNGEMFRQPYSQMLSMNTNVMQGWGRNTRTLPNPDMNETCCAYNLAKLTKELNCFDPDHAEYMDYYERVLYNQIVGSLHPTHYSTTYQYAVGMNAVKPFGNETPQSSCCGGTGAENHVKYQEAAYFVADSTIYVGLYIPSEATWEDRHALIRQDCLWPSEKSTFSVKPIGADPVRAFAMKLRVPYWATEGFDVRLNGKSVGRDYQPCSYVEIPMRQWSPDDVVEVIMPFTVHLCFGPDKMSVAATDDDEHTEFQPQWLGALMYGPLVMTTSDVTDWHGADFALSSDLGEIVANRPTAAGGYAGNLYTLELAGKRFVPDYYATDSTTHYLRLAVDAGTAQKARGRVKTDFTQLRQLIALAHEREASQDAWTRLDVKVPSHAPWAPHGYARMIEAMHKAATVLDHKKATQVEVNAAAAELNARINSMRPGNLAETEDLDRLFPLLMDSRSLRNTTPEVLDAVRHADRVFQYVNDGSGTPDMIDDAISRLNAARRTVHPLGFEDRVKKVED